MARIAAFLLLLAACTPERSSRCTDVCGREAACQGDPGVEEKLDEQQKEALKNFDEGECLDACAALERDPSVADELEAHARCVHDADSCEAVFRCE
jgi:hypothetical protein